MKDSLECSGVNALGPCTHKALYLLLPAPLRRKSNSRLACGVHMAQVVKTMLPEWGAVVVSEIWK